MSDLRKRFEKETGKTVGEIGIYECDSCGNDELEIETWNDNYVFWLENLANGADESTDPALHKHSVSQRSELLAFAKEMQNIGFNEMDDAEKVVDIYLKANCC
nr:hypothetical protein [uncultured Draconibacterium sp.]